MALKSLAWQIETFLRATCMGADKERGKMSFPASVPVSTRHNTTKR